MREQFAAALLILLTACLWPAMASAAPIDRGDAAEPDKAVSHEHWEHIVRRRSIMSRFDTRREDETSHIVNVQEYYRDILEQDWPNYQDNERELFNLLHKLELVSMQRELSDDEWNEKTIG